MKVWGNFWSRSGPITWNEAFIYASGFSYLAASASSLVGYPAISAAFLPDKIQAAFFFVMFITLSISKLNKKLRWGLASFYGMSAMWSFSGLEPWVCYNVAGYNLGPAMAAWDLALAVALLLVRGEPSKLLILEIGWEEILRRF